MSSFVEMHDSHGNTFTNNKVIDYSQNELNEKIEGLWYGELRRYFSNPKLSNVRWFASLFGFVVIGIAVGSFSMWLILK